MSDQNKPCCKTITTAVQNWSCKTAVDWAVKQSLSYPESCPKADTCRAAGGEGCECLKKQKEAGACAMCGSPSHCGDPMSGVMQAAVPVAKKKTTVVVVDGKKKEDKGSDEDKS